MIVVFGGAFNPVTNAHLEVCNFVQKKFPDSTFLYLPVSSAYTKSSLASNYDRLSMLELALHGKKNVVVSQMEMQDSDFLGTYQSLIRLSDAFLEDIYFVVGADNLIGMEKWINIDGILADFKIIILGRNDLDIESLINDNNVLKRHASRFIIFKDFSLDISSTGFRENMDETMVPPRVYQYIKDNELYKGDDKDVS